MRKLMFFTVGFAAATAAAAYLLQGRGLLVLSFVSIVSALILLAFSGKILHITRVILFGCAAAFLWMWGLDFFYLSNIRNLNDQEILLSVETDQYSVSTDYGTTADGSVRIDEKTYRIRFYSYDEMELTPGDVLEGRFRLQYTGGNSGEDIYYSGSGIYLVGYLEDEYTVHKGELALRHYPVIWRHKLLEKMAEVVPEDTAGFAKALLLGEKSGLDYETNTDLAVSGIRHVVAVSGLHVSILCSLVFALLGERRVLTPTLGILLLAVFAALTGFTPSVVRSCIMYALLFGAIGFIREYDPPTALSFAVLVMLVVNPMSVTSVSLQLSVACVVGMFLFSSGIRSFVLSDRCIGKAGPRTTVGKLQRWIADSVSISISTMITTMPLCAVYFGTVSILGTVTNLITLWLISIIFTGLLAAVTLGFVWLPLGRIVGWVLSWLIRLVLMIAKLIASIPFAAVYTKSPYVIAWIVFFYVLIGVFFMCRRKHPLLLTSCAAAALVIAVGLSWLEPRLDGFRFTVLDVGQGQCILVQNEGRHYMIDCGGESDIVVADEAAQTLLSQGITRLDGVIVTHYDSDHIGALQNLLTRVPADTLYLPATDQKAYVYDTYGEGICFVAPESIMRIPEAGLTVFSGDTSASDNESSLCILFQPENCDILITGDRDIAGERKLLKQTDLPQVDVLVVGHHGAKDSAGLELLAEVRPKTTVISVGKDNPYGHPSFDVLERLEMFGCEILRTDIDGTILIRG